jgi:superfamily II DNA helicase RecQ
MSDRFVPVCLEDLLDEKTKAIEVTIRDLLGVPEIHRWQAHALQALLHQKDVVVKAGTGLGKSLVFQAMTLASPTASVLVVCPLVALMDDQVSGLTLRADLRYLRRANSAFALLQFMQTLSLMTH